jgi:hypothetical protein
MDFWVDRVRISPHNRELLERYRESQYDLLRLIDESGVQRRYSLETGKRMSASITLSVQIHMRCNEDCISTAQRRCPVRAGLILP